MLFLLFALLATSEAFLFGKSSNAEWNGLKVTFGLNPFSSYNYDSLPRTVGQAVNDGYTKQSSCDPANGFVGIRYMKGNDKSAVLLFDKNGFIAGLQAMIPNNLPRNVPSQYQRQVFMAEGNQYVLTTYFSKPDTICSKGRSVDQFELEGTGSALYIQNGANPLTDYMAPPMDEKDIGSTQWTKGKCFYVMGMHYWYNTSEDMSCNNLFPIFLLYNKGRLNAYGWALNADMSNPRYEHPEASSFSQFMEVVPKCLAQQGTLSTLHIYLTDSATSNFC